MTAAVADTTQEWLLPAGSRPPTVAELEERIDLALATARASEAAVMSVGAAALDAAEQAKRAAQLAERASAKVASAPTRPASSAPDVSARPRPRTAPPDSGLRGFHAQADRLAERLRRLQRVPLGAS
ncbi:MAG TPA: hypothetical protein VF245_01730 [Solirubrobacterales bacterium]